MTKRSEAYAAIDSERAYQHARWGDKPHEIDAWVTYIADYAHQLQHLATISDSEKYKLDFVRKVAGLCVACLEQHGAPQRSASEIDDAAVKRALGQ
jgi:hypothetical protein